MTEFRIGDDMLDLSPVVDLFDRRIIAYSIGKSSKLLLPGNAMWDALATLDNQNAATGHTTREP